MTALDWYCAFAIAFLVFALWVIREADAARKRLHEKNERDEAIEESPASASNNEEGSPR